MLPAISKTAFWDVNFEELDYEKNAVFITNTGGHENVSLIPRGSPRNYFS